MLPISSSASHNVRMARVRTDVYATSNSKPSFLRSRPASRASSRPRSVRSTSVHPVKRFSLFHVLSPWRSSTSLCTERAPSREPRGGAELRLDAYQLVVLAHAIGAARRSGFDLTGGGADGEVGDRRVFGLAGAVRDDRRVACVGGHPHRVERLGDGADLIQLHQQRVADLVVDPLLENRRIGHEHVVADELYAIAERGRQLPPPVPIAFGEAVFDRDDRILPDPVLVQTDHLLGGSVGFARFL